VVHARFAYPGSGASIVPTDNSDQATNAAKYKVTAVQVMPIQHAPASDQSPQEPVPLPAVQLPAVQGQAGPQLWCRW
jgi:hypothetical protein